MDSQTASNSTNPSHKLDSKLYSDATVSIKRVNLKITDSLFLNRNAELKKDHYEVKPHS